MCLNNCTVLQFYSAFWSFGSQRFYKSHKPKMCYKYWYLITVPTLWLLPRKYINHFFSHPLIFPQHLLISLAYMHPDLSCSPQVCFWWNHAVTAVLVHFAFLLTYPSGTPTAHFMDFAKNSLLFLFCKHLFQPWGPQISKFNYLKIVLPISNVTNK